MGCGKVDAEALNKYLNIFDKSDNVVYVGFVYLGPAEKHATHSS